MSARKKPPIDFTFSTPLPADDCVAIKARIEKNTRRNPVTSCLEWTKRVSQAGYARTTLRERGVAVSRLSYAVHKGVIGRGLGVLHSCDNPLCVEPSHLSLGTPRDNAMDRQRRHRGKLAILTPEQIPLIRSGFEEGLRDNELAERFGVKPRTIKAIRQGQIWSRVPSANPSPA